MALTKEIVQDKIEILEDGTMQVRTCTRILEDGVVISQNYHRHAVTPGADTANESSRVQALAAVEHTTERVAAYQAKQNANETHQSNKRRYNDG